MTKRNAFAAKRRNDEFLENQTAWKNLPVPRHLNFILTALMPHICLKTEGLVQRTVNCIKTINFLMTNFSPSQIWINFRKSQEISRFSYKGISKNFRSEISFCRFDTLTRNKGLRNFFEICRGGSSNIMRFVDSLLFLVSQNDTSTFTVAKCCNIVTKSYKSSAANCLCRLQNFFRPAMKWNR